MIEGNTGWASAERFAMTQVRIACGVCGVAVVGTTCKLSISGLAHFIRQALPLLNVGSFLLSIRLVPR